MNIGDVYFGKREIYFDVHVKPTFVLASTVKLILLIFGEFSTNMWVETWDILHTPNARWLAYYGLHILAWEFVEVLNYRVFFPSSGSHKHSAHFVGEIDWPGAET